MNISDQAAYVVRYPLTPERWDVTRHLPPLKEMDSVVGKETVEHLLEENVCDLKLHLRSTLRLPAVVLQDNKEIASYPANWWEAIKDRLGFTHKRISVRMREAVVFPTMRLDWSRRPHWLHITTQQDHITTSP